MPTYRVTYRKRGRGGGGGGGGAASVGGAPGGSVGETLVRGDDEVEADLYETKGRWFDFIKADTQDGMQSRRVVLRVRARDVVRVEEVSEAVTGPQSPS